MNEFLGSQPQVRASAFLGHTVSPIDFSCVEPRTSKIGNSESLVDLKTLPVKVATTEYFVSGGCHPRERERQLV